MAANGFNLWVGMDVGIVAYSGLLSCSFVCSVYRLLKFRRDAAAPQAGNFEVSEANTIASSEGVF